MRRAHSITRRSLAAAIVTLLASTAPWASQDTVLPDAPGVEIARAKCLGCHGADMIVGQRLSPAGWGREIDKMVRWGAAVTEQERAPLTQYLSRFGPTPAASHPRASEGKAVLERACLSCHGVDMIEGQRLSTAGWTREVDKMVRWGAKVGEADKGALVDYLSQTYPVR